MFDTRAAAKLIIARQGKHCATKMVILDIPCQVQVHKIMGHQRMV